jgi:hypothetical protein
MAVNNNRTPKAAHDGRYHSKGCGRFSASKPNLATNKNPPMAGLRMIGKLAQATLDVLEHILDAHLPVAARNIRLKAQLVVDLQHWGIRIGIASADFIHDWAL